MLCRKAQRCADTSGASAAGLAAIPLRDAVDGRARAWLGDASTSVSELAEYPIDIALPGTVVQRQLTLGGSLAIVQDLHQRFEEA